MDELKVCRKIDLAIGNMCEVISGPGDVGARADYYNKAGVTFCSYISDMVLALSKARERMGNVYPDDAFRQEPVGSDGMMAMMDEVDDMKNEIAKYQVIMKEQERLTKDLIMEKKTLMAENTKLKKVLMGQLVADDGPV